MNEDEDGRSAAVVGYCEEEREGGLGDGGVDDRASVLSLSLSPSRTLHTYESAHR